jgi:hypothetical protein
LFWFFFFSLICVLFFVLVFLKVAFGAMFDFVCVLLCKLYNKIFFH